MTTRFDQAMMDLFSHYRSLSRHDKFQAGAIRLTTNIAWPVEMDARGGRFALSSPNLTRHDTAKT